MGRTRIWCETLALETLARREVLELLYKHGVDPIVAVRPGEERAVGAVLGGVRDAGLRPAVWPMLCDRDGRWGSAWNAPVFLAWLKKVLRAAGDPGEPPLEIVFDLEPPFELVAGALSSQGRSNARRQRVFGLRHPWLRGLAQARSLRTQQTRAALSEVVQELRAAGFRSIGTFAPMVLLDSLPSRSKDSQPCGGWQALLGTPVDGIAWDRVSVMAYTSILQGWSRGVLDREAALAVLDLTCARNVLRFGDAAGVSLGAVGTGALGDEPVYRGVEQLREDVCLARSHGINDIALFDLRGVLARRDAEAWLEALRAEGPRPQVRKSFRAAAAIASSRAVGLGVEMAHRSKGKRGTAANR